MLDIDDADQPRLPLELEEQIFLFAVDQRPQDAWNLTLVAKRVHQLLIPRIFNIAIFYDNDKTSPIRFNLAIFEKYAKHVRHLFLLPLDLVQHLHLFTNITDLVLYRQDFEPSQLEILLTFKHLTRLSIGIDSSIPPNPIYFSLFAKVTHLDLNGRCGSWSIPAIRPFINFPLLTHLCILVGSNVELVKLLLDRNRCRKLEVVALWGSLGGDRYETIVTPGGERKIPLKDDRIIPVSVPDVVRDWENGAKGGDDMWKVAERELALRRLGK